MEQSQPQSTVASKADAAAPGLLDFTKAERAAILRHGPWPPPPPRDPGNRFSGRPEAVALGRRLFADPRLSPDGRIACATCHVPALGFADGRPRAAGRDGPLDRHTPSLWNTGLHRWWGWDGAFDSLWSQALHPLQQPQEMASHAAHLRSLLRQDAALACALDRLAPQASRGGDDLHLLVALGKALGAYGASLVSGRTAFDGFRDALARGDRRTAARYPLAAQRGLRLFIGRGRCALCHSGPLFSNGEFADVGVPFFARPGVVDAGRHGGLIRLQGSPFNLLGPHADRPPAGSEDPALRTRHVWPQQRNFGEFKVPGLRGVADTAPYMHDGQLPTLRDVLRHYSSVSPDRLHADGEQILQALHLRDDETDDLLAFLESLRPLRPPQPATAPAAAPRAQGCPGGRRSAMR